MKKTNDALKKAIERISTPIFEKALKETRKNPLSVVGLVGLKKKKDLIVYYQPHNYRLYFDFKRDNYLNNFDDLTDIKRSVVISRNGVTCNFRIINSKEHEFSDFLDCRIVVKKSQIEITNKIDHKKVYVIDISNKDFIRGQIKDIVDVKDSQCLGVLKKFVDIFGGVSAFNVLKRHSEDKILNEKHIDTIPVKAKFHNKVGKKVYNEKGFEFYDPAFASNCIENLSLASFSPEIEDRLRAIENKVIPVNKDLSALEKIDLYLMKEAFDGSYNLFYFQGWDM